MKRNVFGGLIVAGGLALSTSVASFASDTTPTAAPDPVIAACAATLVLTPASTFSGEAKNEATQLNAETTQALNEVTGEANGAIQELVAENVDEDNAKDAQALAAEKQAIETSACLVIANLKAEYGAAILELKAAQPEVNKPEVDKPEIDKPEVEKPEVDKPEVQSTTREGND